jgi:hypothetical protein
MLSRSRPLAVRSAPRALLALCLLSALGCGTASTGAPPSAETDRAHQPDVPSPDVPAAPSYSPFVVDLHAGSPAALPFHLISFKDVGMSLPDDAARQRAYESLAEALSLELAVLSTELGANMTPSVRHDHRITDPSAHLACEGGHLYVDVWRSGTEGNYGYSLWSGCGEDDRFAYNEQVVASRDEASAMDPLAEEIADSLEGALRARCFQRAC